MGSLLEKKLQAEGTVLIEYNIFEKIYIFEKIGTMNTSYSHQCFFILATLVGSVFFSGCAGRSNNVSAADGSGRIDSVRLVKTGELRLALDEETTPMMQSTFYDSLSGYYYFYNKITGYIERFHTDSTVKSPVRIKTPVMPWSMNIVSPDSIYIMDFMDRDDIRLIDRDGVQSASYSLDDKSSILPGGQGQPYVTSAGLVYSSNADNDFCLAVIDAVTGEVSEKLIPYPDLYRDFYGDLLMRVPYTAYNGSKSITVTGFPADDNIHVLDLISKKVTSYYAGSIYRDNNLKPLAKGLLGGMRISTDKEIEYFREITSYGNIVYDPWRNVYYRIVEKSTPMPGVSLSNKAKKLAVIVLDQNFRIIGESDISDNAHATFRYSLFVSRNGLNIQLLTGDDELAFAVYSVEKNDRYENN